MSDPTRKGFSEKASEHLKPEEQKGYLEQTKEHLSETADKLQAKLHPEENKSDTQKVSDKLEGKSGGKEESWGDTAQRYTGHAKDYAEQARGKINEALNTHGDQAREKISEIINSHGGGTAGGAHGPK